jgi:hypothetical protein
MSGMQEPGGRLNASDEIPPGLLPTPTSLTKKDAVRQVVSGIQNWQQVHGLPVRFPPSVRMGLLSSS